MESVPRNRATWLTHIVQVHVHTSVELSSLQGENDEVLRGRLLSMKHFLSVRLSVLHRRTHHRVLGRVLFFGDAENAEQETGPGIRL